MLISEIHIFLECDSSQYPLQLGFVLTPEQSNGLWYGAICNIVQMEPQSFFTMGRSFANAERLNLAMPGGNKYCHTKYTEATNIVILNTQRQQILSYLIHRGNKYSHTKYTEATNIGILNTQRQQIFSY